MLRLCHLWLAPLFIAVIACAKGVDHDENLAAQRASEFTDVAFVKRDVTNSYPLLSDAAKRYVPIDKFKETIDRLHRGTYPTSIVATEYEPMSGENAIYIYLSGENSTERFYYTVTMEGSARSDYRVSRFTRSADPAASYGQKKRLSVPQKRP
jgi:hypothetical protein